MGFGQCLFFGFYLISMSDKFLEEEIHCLLGHVTRLLVLIESHSNKNILGLRLTCVKNLQTFVRISTVLDSSFLFKQDFNLPK